jgi:hypothetical protein
MPPDLPPLTPTATPLGPRGHNPPGAGACLSARDGAPTPFVAPRAKPPPPPFGFGESGRPRIWPVCTAPSPRGSPRRDANRPMPGRAFLSATAYRCPSQLTPLATLAACLRAPSSDAVCACDSPPLTPTTTPLKAAWPCFAAPRRGWGPPSPALVAAGLPLTAPPPFFISLRLRHSLLADLLRRRRNARLATNPFPHRRAPPPSRGRSLRSLAPCRSGGPAPRLPLSGSCGGGGRRARGHAGAPPVSGPPLSLRSAQRCRSAGFFRLPP